MIDFARSATRRRSNARACAKGRRKNSSEIELLPRRRLPLRPRHLRPPIATPPRTKLLRHPAKLLRVAPGKRKLVVFRFASNERGSTFRCKLDGKPYRPCASPRAYKVALGRHAVRIFAIDAAGNADRSPALFRFRVRRR